MDKMDKMDNIDNIDTRFNYGNMYNWTNDLPKNSIIYFLNIIDLLNKKNKVNRILEIGTYTGTSAIKLAELIKNPIMTVIDKWEDYTDTAKNAIGIVDKIKDNKIEQIFYKNIEIAGMKDIFKVLKGCSFFILLDLIKSNEKFDMIYVDGDHTLLHSYMDIKLSFELLENGGILIIDDRLYNKDDILNSPFEGIKKFILEYNTRIKVLYIGYRVFLEKLV
jgi:predicted O-methyltransferase YrrM